MLVAFGRRISNYPDEVNIIQNNTLYSDLKYMYEGPDTTHFVM